MAPRLFVLEHSVDNRLFRSLDDFGFEEDCFLGRIRVVILPARAVHPVNIPVVERPFLSLLHAIPLKNVRGV